MTVYPCHWLTLILLVAYKLSRRALTFKLAGGQVGNYQRNGNKLPLFIQATVLQIFTFIYSSRIMGGAFQNSFIDSDS